MPERTIDDSESQVPTLARRVEPQDAPLQHVSTDRITTILETGAKSGMDPGALKQLADLLVLMEGRNAAKEFGRALAAFQDECPPVPHDKTARIVSQSKGTGFDFTYSTHEAIVTHIRPYLTKHGLSFTFDTEEDGGKLTTICVLRHIAGHSVTSKVKGSIESGPHGISKAFKTGRRLALAGALGLTTTESEPETGDEPVENLPTVSEEQVATIEALMQEVKQDPRRFLEAYGVASVKDLPAVNFKGACRALEAKRGRKP